MFMYVVSKLRLTPGSRKETRSRLGFQAWKDGEDEVPERGVLSDEEA